MHAAYSSPHADAEQLELNEHLGIEKTGELKTMLINALNRNRNLTVNIHQGSEISVAALQLLYAAQRRARDQGQRFIFDSATWERFSDVLELGGLSSASPQVDQ